MSARRLEEILEECLSAYLDGRRSIEESLSLYPFYASELEPMLRTATGINFALNSYSPPAHVQQRGLNRFLSDARARRNMKSLQVGAVRPSRFAITWQKYRLGFAGAAMAVLILAVSVGGTALIGEGNDTTVSGFPDTATPAVVINLQQQVDTVRSRQASQSLTAEDIVRLRAATEALQNATDGEIDSARDSIADALNDANTLVNEIIATQDPELAQPAQDAQNTIRDVAAVIDVALASPTPVVDTVTPEPTVAPTEEPTPTPEPTAAPTEAPTPTLPPPPSDTPPPRDLA